MAKVLTPNKNFRKSDYLSKVGNARFLANSKGSSSYGISSASKRTAGSILSQSKLKNK